MLVSFAHRSPPFGKDHVMCGVVSGGRNVEMWTERVTVWFITATTVSWSAIIAGLSAVTLGVWYTHCYVRLNQHLLVLIMPYQHISIITCCSTVLQFQGLVVRYVNKTDRWSVGEPSFLRCLCASSGSAQGSPVVTGPRPLSTGYSRMGVEPPQTGFARLRLSPM